MALFAWLVALAVRSTVVLLVALGLAWSCAAQAPRPAMAC